MNNPFVIPLGLAFIAGSVITFVSLVRRIANYPADARKAAERGHLSWQEWRRNTVLCITCGAILLLSLLNLSVTYVKAFRHTLEGAGEVSSAPPEVPTRLVLTERPAAPARHRTIDGIW